MPEQPKLLIQPGKYYHIYNRGVNCRTIFQDGADYARFLFYVEKYMAPVGKTYAYALPENHFHLLISTYPKEVLPHFLLKDKLVLGRTFGHIQNAYAKYFNHKYKTVSGLFEKGFERKEVASQSYFTTLVLYLHRNGVKHKLADDIYAYPWSSLQELNNQFRETFLSRQETWAKFGGRASFIAAHDLLDEKLLDMSFEFEEDF